MPWPNFGVYLPVIILTLHEAEIELNQISKKWLIVQKISTLYKVCARGHKDLQLSFEAFPIW
jgi:hypothetical protein